MHEQGLAAPTASDAQPMAAAGTPLRLTTRAWIVLAVLAAILVLPALIPMQLGGPWSRVEAGVDLFVWSLSSAILYSVVRAHPSAGTTNMVGLRRVWKPEARFLLMVFMCLAIPAGLMFFGLVWRVSHGWAALWALCSAIGALLTYVVGRPWSMAVTPPRTDAA